MNFVLVFALWSGPAPAPATPGDRWFGPDKLLHFTASALIQSVAHTALRSRGMTYANASWSAAGVTAVAGIGKELWDLKRHDDFSLRDLTWDVVGGASGAVLMRQADR
ncbi:MAG: hypothetical protein NTU67_03545 [Gemmatimonadetes bacterium]|nr:hypothetical protein [Gemmatimonadota bacterium]